MTHPFQACCIRIKNMTWCTTKTTQLSAAAYLSSNSIAIPYDREANWFANRTTDIDGAALMFVIPEVGFDIDRPC